MTTPFPDSKPTPTFLRKCADDILRQGREYTGQISFTRGGHSLAYWFDAYAGLHWAGGSTIEKAMMCHFFAEYLEGETA